MNEEELEHALGKWEVDFPEDPHFRSAVWREIAMRDAASPANRFREALERLLSPRLAIPAAAVAVVAVLVTATFHGENSSRRAWNNLASAYSSAIDPVAHTEALVAIADSQR